MTPKILSSCHAVGQPDSMTRSYLFTLQSMALLPGACTAEPNAVCIAQFVASRDLNSFSFPLNLSLLCPYPLNLSLLGALCKRNQPVDVSRRCSS